ncbi:MAG: LexA family transcriptional regulator [Cyclobacteriaceae bacterium]
MAQKISKIFSFVGQNIKKIRQARKISQAEFASLFNLARPSIGAYEEGRSEPKIETLIQMANHFNISIDVLLNRELTVSDIYSFDKVNKKLDRVHNLKETSKRTASVPIVNINQYVDYLVNYQNNDFLKRLDLVGVPIAAKGITRAFEHKGSEMEYQMHGLHHGDILFANSAVPANSDDLIGDVLVIVMNTGIVVRRLLKIENGIMHLRADDPNYHVITCDTNEVFEIWRVTHVFSQHLHPPTRMEERLLRIEEELSNLKKG